MSTIYQRSAAAFLFAIGICLATPIAEATMPFEGIYGSGYQGGGTCNPPFNVPTAKPARVLTNPNLAVILWNSNVWSEIANNAPLFYSDLDELGSSYISSLQGDYGVSTGYYRGTTTLAPHYSVPCTIQGGVSICGLTEAAINNELAYQIANNTNMHTPEADGGFDSLGYSNNLLYVVHLPPNYILSGYPLSGTVTLQNGSPTITFSTTQTISAGTSFVFSVQPTVPYILKSGINSGKSGTLTASFTGSSTTTATVTTQQCGFHEEMKDNAGHSVAVAYLADPQPGSFCYNGFQWSGLGPIQDVFFDASHEVIEASVNPFQRTRNNNGEVGDYCQCSNHYTGYQGGGGTAAWTTFAGFWRTWTVQQPYMWTTQSCQTMQIAPATTLNANTSSGAAMFSTSSSTQGYFWAPINGILDAAVASQGSNWANQQIYAGGPVVAGSQIAAVSVGSQYNAFYIGGDSNVYTTQTTNLSSWSTLALTGPGSATGANFPAPPGAGISAVAVGPGIIEVYFADDSGKLHEIYWKGNNTWAVGATDPLATAVTPGASIATIRRSNVNLDVFFINQNGGITQLDAPLTGSWTTSTLNGVSNLSPGGSIAAAARTWSKIDLFFNDSSGNARTAFWSEDAPTWGTIATTGGSSSVGVVVAATPSPFDLSTFFVDNNGIEQASWYWWGRPGAGTWSLTPVVPNSDGGVFAVGQVLSSFASTPGQLNVFELDTNGTPHTEFSAYDPGSQLTLWYNTVN